MTAPDTQPQPIDLIITGGTVITMNDRGEVYPGGAIAVNADTIVAVGPQADILARFQPRKKVILRGRHHSPGPGQRPHPRGHDLLSRSG